MFGKVVGFAKGNWDSLVVIGIIAVAETAICKIYKDYVDSL